MQKTVSSESNSEFNRDVGDVFRLFTLPRRELASQGDTGFWDTTDSVQFGELLLEQFRKNLIYIVNRHFPDQSEPIVNQIDVTLGNYMNEHEEISVTFYYNRNYPIGIEVTDEFVEGKKIATISRKRAVDSDLALSQPDVKMFDWLYGVYIQGRTGKYDDESNYSLTLSIRNTKNYVDYSAKAEDYSLDVSNRDSQTKLQKVLQYI